MPVWAGAKAAPRWRFSCTNTLFASWAIARYAAAAETAWCIALPSVTASSRCLPEEAVCISTAPSDFGRAMQAIGAGGEESRRLLQAVSKLRLSAHWLSATCSRRCSVWAGEAGVLFSCSVRCISRVVYAMTRSPLTKMVAACRGLLGLNMSFVNAVMLSDRPLGRLFAAGTHVPQVRA